MTTPGAISMAYVAPDIPKGQEQYVAYMKRLARLAGSSDRAKLLFEEPAQNPVRRETFARYTKARHKEVAERRTASCGRMRGNWCIEPKGPYDSLPLYLTHRNIKAQPLAARVRTLTGKKTERNLHLSAQHAL